MAVAKEELFVARGEAVVSGKGAARLFGGHLWVYESDVVKRPAGGAGVVAVVDAQGHRLGQALFSPNSAITLRLVTRGRDVVSAALVRGRLQEALARRQRCCDGDAYRWVHGEGDLLPSIFIDRYGDAVSMQILSAGADLWADCLVEWIAELAAPRAIVIRNDATARRREGLALESRIPLGAPPVIARFSEGEVAYEVDLASDQKTGSFLDQRLNHLRAAHYARGTTLDCFTYHGGFALQLARRAEHVTAVDSSGAALSRARANAERIGAKNVELVEADVFELLPELGRRGELFDTIVLDPPAFASDKASEPKARAAYKEINRRAMRLLRPGGVLVTCSCSGRITPDVFDEVVAAAAREAKRSVQILERRGAGPDHPVLAGVPETDYLKCRILCVL